MRNYLNSRRVLTAITALGLFALAARPVVDPDLWWHLKTGELILRNHAVFHTDPFSFTRAGAPWLNHEWLSDVGMFLLYRTAGWGGLIVVFSLLIAGTFMLVFYRCTGERWVAAALTLWAALASLPVWDIRPQILSFLLASVLLALHDRARTRNALIWWALPLMLLWINLHGGYALGIVLIAIFLIGAAFDSLVGFETRATTSPRIKTLALLLLACLAMVPLNPSGAKLYWYPFATLKSPSMQRYIAEWSSPNFHQAQFLPLALLMLATLALLALSPRRLAPGKLLLLLATNFAALLSIRHIGIYALVAAPILSELLSLPSSHGTSIPTRRPAYALNALVLILFFTFVVVHVRSVIVGQPAVITRHFPEHAATYLAHEHLLDPMFNHYDWGGYFIWRLYPEHKVFIDGRADVYGDAMMEAFAATYSLSDDWRRSLDEWHIRTVVLPPDAPLVTALQSSADWKKVYSDGQATILRRNH